MTSLWVTTLAGSTFTNFEVTKADQLNLFTLGQGSLDGAEYCVNSSSSVLHNLQIITITNKEDLGINLYWGQT